MTQRCDGYVDLRSYAAIGDGRTVALVARDGSVDWYPVPDLDSMPIFGCLLDAENGGAFQLCPTTEFQVERAYLAGTNILCSTYTCGSGQVRVTDALNTGAGGDLPWGESRCPIGRIRAHLIRHLRRQGAAPAALSGATPRGPSGCATGPAGRQ
ncbi:hypothetical protein F0Q45_05865 [Mycobacterium simiae]|uniref:Trehalase-like N-terminal domain-containing protein n=1 Tax=Mycobacterium simiae TaxID=1784 RepID=A0A5B1BV38_MYCSI|nr:trehalase-like domain-containing protein [Mycobacterium simiae]KAA1251104.1 hypothetical protein F0Q45_05865 [Mycobacterium simiae]